MQEEATAVRYASIDVPGCIVQELFTIIKNAVFLVGLQDN